MNLTTSPGIKTTVTTTTGPGGVTEMVEKVTEVGNLFAPTDLSESDNSLSISLTSLNSTCTGVLLDVAQAALDQLDPGNENFSDLE